MMNMCGRSLHASTRTAGMTNIKTRVTTGHVIDMSKPTKWTHFGILSATVGVTLSHDFKNIFN